MKFWIVTPSYNQLEWLKLSIASVRNQIMELPIADYQLPNNSAKSKAKDPKPFFVHHHVQDGGSTDGTVDWLCQYAEKIIAGQKNHEKFNSQCQEQNASLFDYTFSYASEPDKGMYDAINRGWKLASDDVDVIAHLNCDEQYLPNALQTITDFLHVHQKIDVVLADMIVVNRNGEYICHRRSLRPYALTSRFCCAGSTATTFQRAAVTKKKKVFFDTSWRNFGDKVWYNALHRAKCRFAVCNQMVAIFAETGNNLNWTNEGRNEKRRYESEFLHNSILGTVLIARFNGLRRAWLEIIMDPPLVYSLYKNAESERKTLPIINPTGLWHKKWK